MSQQNNNTIDQVVIVGGGTAGWLTAAKLAKKLNSNSPGGVQVTLVESPDIPTIGVGEGTWPTMRKTLAELEISEHEFLTYCHASFKQATKFVNWQRTPEQGQSNHYYHLFSSIVNADEFNLSPYWSLSDQQVDYASYISPQAALCEQGLAPKSITNKPYEGLVNYAYHLDAGKFAELLQKVSCERLGVKHIKANVGSVNLAENGNIKSITLAHDNSEVLGDFFVDCTGFHCLLLNKTYQIPFKPINDVLFTDHAIAMQVPYPDETTSINSSTISTAHSAGWTWDIGLANRRGTGYVYCSDFVSHDEAEATLRNYVGAQAKDLECRRIKMNCGYREKFWHNNCVAIGLSAAFVEPLEASAIFLIEASANMLCQQFPRHQSLLKNMERKFNESFHFRWQRTIEFIKLHYFLSKRTEDFWVANRELSTVPDSLLEQLENWRYQAPSQYDFDHVYEPFLQDSYQYVLHGMLYQQELNHNASSYQDAALAANIAAKNQQLTQQLINQLPTNRELLKKVKAYGFQHL